MSTVTRLRTAPKLFVLDTNVLMHDPTSLFRFEEHDVYLPMVTLEELDNHKKGMSEVARNARQASRFLDELVSSAISDIDEGIPLQPHGSKNATGRLFLQTEAISSDLPMRLASGKADNQILGVVMYLHEAHPKRDVVLVSKDINMRIKARALGLRGRGLLQRQGARGHRPALLRHAGAAGRFLGQARQGHGVLAAGRLHLLPRAAARCAASFMVNQFVYLEQTSRSTRRSRRRSGKTAVLQTLKDYTHQKNNVWGITARNREQNFALNLLMNPGSRLRHAARPGRHRQDAADAGRRA